MLLADTERKIEKLLQKLVNECEEKGRTARRLNVLLLSKRNAQNADFKSNTKK